MTVFCSTRPLRRPQRLPRDNHHYIALYPRLLPSTASTRTAFDSYTSSIWPSTCWPRRHAGIRKSPRLQPPAMVTRTSARGPGREYQAKYRRLTGPQRLPSSGSARHPRLLRVHPTTRLDRSPRRTSTASPAFFARHRETPVGETCSALHRAHPGAEETQLRLPRRRLPAARKSSAADGGPVDRLPACGRGRPLQANARRPSPQVPKNARSDVSGTPRTARRCLPRRGTGSTSPGESSEPARPASLHARLGASRPPGHPPDPGPLAHDRGPPAYGPASSSTGPGASSYVRGGWSRLWTTSACARGACDPPLNCLTSSPRNRGRRRGMSSASSACLVTSSAYAAVLRGRRVGCGTRPVQRPLAAPGPPPASTPRWSATRPAVSGLLKDRCRTAVSKKKNRSRTAARAANPLWGGLYLNFPGAGVGRKPTATTRVPVVPGLYTYCCRTCPAPGMPAFDARRGAVPCVLSARRSNNAESRTYVHCSTTCVFLSRPARALPDAPRRERGNEDGDVSPTCSDRVLQRSPRRRRPRPCRPCWGNTARSTGALTKRRARRAAPHWSGPLPPALDDRRLGPAWTSVCRGGC